HVAPHPEAGRPARRRGGERSIRVQVGEDDRPRSLGGESPAERRADPAPAAGDHHHLARDLHPSLSSIDTEYAPGRASRIWSAQGSIPSTRRSGSKTVGSHSDPRYVLSSSRPATATSRSSGHMTV